MAFCNFPNGRFETRRQRSDRSLVELLDSHDRVYVQNLRRHQKGYRKPILDPIYAFMNSNHLAGDFDMHTNLMSTYFHACPYCPACGSKIRSRSLPLARKGSPRCHNCAILSFISLPTPAMGQRQYPWTLHPQVNLWPPYGPFSLGMDLDMVELMHRRVWEQVRGEEDRLKSQQLNNRDELKARRWVESKWRGFAPLQGFENPSGGYNDSIFGENYKSGDFGMGYDGRNFPEDFGARYPGSYLNRAVSNIGMTRPRPNFPNQKGMPKAENEWYDNSHRMYMGMPKSYHKNRTHKRYASEPDEFMYSRHMKTEPNQPPEKPDSLDLNSGGSEPSRGENSEPDLEENNYFREYQPESRFRSEKLAPNSQRIARDIPRRRTVRKEASHGKKKRPS
jgi:hypothetical protein